LQESQYFEQFVAGAKSTGEKHSRLGAFQQMKLADGEVVKPEAQIGRDISVGLRLARQGNVQADTRRTAIVSADSRPP
jgi:hypothetical protein